MCVLTTVTYLYQQGNVPLHTNMSTFALGIYPTSTFIQFHFNRNLLETGVNICCKACSDIVSTSYSYIYKCAYSYFVDITFCYSVLVFLFFSLWIVHSVQVWLCTDENVLLNEYLNHFIDPNMGSSSSSSTTNKKNTTQHPEKKSIVWLNLPIHTISSFCNVHDG